MDLNRQEMFAVVGEQTLQIAALQKEVISLQAKLKEATKEKPELAVVDGGKSGTA